MSAETGSYEYIVVGSGAGGGVVAARLAQAGHTVLLLEAGGDYKDLQGGGPVSPDQNRLPEDYEVPTFHPMASENDALKWDYFVRHYRDTERQERDEKFVRDRDGVLYPRAGTLGGCTAHNAMITVYPHNADWDHIADITGDNSTWRAGRMRRYFQRLENCRHRWPYRLLYRLTGLNPTRHGFDGWLSVEKAIPKRALYDGDLVSIVTKSAWDAYWELAGLWKRITWFFQSQGDPNDWRLVKKNAIGVYYAPIHTHKHARNSTRELLLDVARRHPDRLKIELEALATEVLFDDSNRAIGVAYLKGARLYRASYQPSDAPGVAADRSCHARGDPGRRRVQYAAIADALGHRSQRRARQARHQRARRFARRRQQPAGPLRGRRRQSSETRLDDPEGRHVHAATIRRARSGRAGAGACTRPMARRSPSSSVRCRNGRCRICSSSR